ncbi:MAG: riboflavin biosynthesis protein RibF [Firmicutes bacterium]|nr:riboflavin biosynthesis protein RibF [Bacillota bacterium]
MNPHRSARLANGPTAVTIGNFDGVHRGHQALIARTLEAAVAEQLGMVVVTFDPHPALILRGSIDRFLITPDPLKQRYLTEAGAQDIVTLPFTPAFRDMEPEVFLDHVLREELQARYVVVGDNFTFGRGGRGRVDFLRDWGLRQHIRVEVLPPERPAASDRPISSSWIRQLIQAGNLAEAIDLLGHPFTVAAVVSPGEQRGRALTVPTLNFEPPSTQVMPPFGVYAGFLTIQEQTYPAVANWGVRPTFGGGRPRWEVHALEPVSWDLYGRTVEFDVIAWVRDEQQFESPEALRRQIGRDVEQARALLEGRR